MIAEALALAGCEVSYVTDHRPIFYEDLSVLPAHERVNLSITSDFAKNLTAGPVDLVVVVPSHARSPEFYRRCLYFARRKSARLGLLNFEDGAWFNSLSPEPRDLRVWDNWMMITRFASLILSSADESRRHAERFYLNTPESVLFAHAYPSINDVAADRVSRVEREDRILVMSRFGNARHKGGHRLAELMSPAMRGYTIVLIVGAGAVPAQTLAELERRAAEVGARIELKSKLSDEDKFREIKRAKLVLFPSMFEGFGYPPVEAQYCNTPCVAFDLPVLREHSPEGVHYVERGNWDAFGAKIEEVLDAPFEERDLKSRIAPIATVESFARRLDPIIAETLRRPRPRVMKLWMYCSYAALRSGLRGPRQNLRKLLTRTNQAISK
jgi:glycosyltransferase involved in cell wall biosynthesis